MNNYLKCFPKENERNCISYIFHCVWMKLLLLAILLSSGIAPALAQEITLKKERSSLDSVFKDVERQVDFFFFYKKEEIKPVGKITINLKSVPLRQALTTILSGTDLEFEIFEKTIVIKKKVPVKSDLKVLSDTSKIDFQRIIKGYVTDENKLPIKGVLIKELISKIHTYSNEKGEYVLSGPPSGSLSFSGKKYNEQIVDYNDTTSFIEVKMENQSIALNEVTVSMEPRKLEPGRFVEMKNRNYMNLSQILQGTVPGLSLQIVNTTSKIVTSVDAYVHIKNGQLINNLYRFSVEEYLNWVGRAVGQANIDLLLSGKNVPTSLSNLVKLNTTTSTTSTLVPQIRGGNSFTNNGANMLVVIDGFPQDGFPADYPMINVESIEVIKDPKELIKWGSRAAGGVILVRTKAGKKGKIEVTYTTNFYYTPAQKFSREKLQLASTADYLDYLKDVDGISGVQYTNASLNFSPARRLFAQKRNGLITTEAYNKTLDSLKGLDNESQMQLLQQDRFSQSHALGLNGGTTNYKFNLMTNYVSEKSSTLNGYSKGISFSLNNDINLLKNKLKINWLINYSNLNSRTGYSFSPDIKLEPYQMLLDQQGNYVYDYSTFSPYANATIMANGYKDYGVNILQDATVNRDLSRSFEKKSNFNAKWELLPGLNLATSLYYVNTNKKTSYLYGAESSYARQLVDNYGEYSTTGINFYVPYGDILQANTRKTEEFNLRSGLTYTKVLGQHEISASVGGGIASISSNSPTTPTIYGYNSADNTSSQVFLPAPNPLASIRNFYSILPDGTSSINPYLLTVPVNGDSTLSRNVNSNAGISYKYGDRINVSGTYTSVYTPLYGQTASYAVSKSYKAEVSGMVLKNIGKVVKNIFLSTGVDATKLPDLPSSYSNTRYQQTTWQNYTIWVNGLTATQQTGQSSRTINQKLTLGLLDSALMLNGAYNTQIRKGTLSTLVSDPTASNLNGDTTIRYFSAGLKGRMRKGLLNFQVDYNKSPEGKTQVNGFGNYDIGHETYLNSNTISSLNVGFKIENISSFQGLSLMMGTNATSNGSYSLATNSDFSLLPPRNTSYELSAQMGLNDDAQTFDVRYYHQSSSGLNNFAPVATDPATGVSSRVTYSTITNKGVEFFFKTRLIKSSNFEYSVTLNGAYNVNIADQVPVTAFTGTDSYANAYREGYDITNLWSVKSAGLNSEGNPQIYDANGHITSTLDSATVVNAMVYSGVTRAPWTGGLIQEASYKSFFVRASLTFNLGHVMRTYIPYLTTSGSETSALITDRWRNPGDEAFTNVPKITNDLGNTYRSYVTRMGTNSIVSADNIRFQELMIGCNVSPALLKKWGLGALTIALQAQNLAVWTNNSLHVDPATVSGSGKVGMPIAKQYSCNISVSF